jgi:hypothetical protein
MPKLGAVIEGLEILAKYSKNGRESHGVAAEHEIIYAGGSDIEELDDIPEEDRERLKELGWFWAEDVSSWAIYT